MQVGNHLIHLHSGFLYHGIIPPSRMIPAGTDTGMVSSPDITGKGISHNQHFLFAYRTDGMKYLGKEFLTWLFCL